MGYAYRKMTPAQRAEALALRRLANFPLHEPPHFERDSNLYLLSAANYEHQPILKDVPRRDAYQLELLTLLAEIPDTVIYAWCILPNHYHVLARVKLPEFSSRIGRLHNGTSTRWNREDGTPGRTVWYRFVDRGIRSEAHYWATITYIHGNPVKHGHVSSPEAWPTSSIHHYLELYGKEAVETIAEQYPALDYGKGWDW